MAAALVRRLIRLAVTAGILAAVYLLIVRPLIDTTDNTITQAFGGSSGLVDQIREQLDDAGIDGLELTLGSAGQAQKLLGCVQRAGKSAERVQRCVKRYGGSG